jgi:CheY-specific phosphatase CheX
MANKNTQDNKNTVTNNQLSILSSMWLYLKDEEKRATDERREIENQLLSLIGLEETFEGTETSETDEGYVIKIGGRMNRKVDSDKLQELAAENGLTEHLSSLFRWSADINTTLWKAASKDITTPLLDAITTKPGRPSFTITLKEK